MKKTLATACLVLATLVARADYSMNPYINQAIIGPAPLLPVEFGGTGTCSFNIGNTGSDPLPLVTNQEMTLVISLSYGVPDNADPLAALGGTWKDMFDWSYDPSITTYFAKQNQDIPGFVPGNPSLGTITIQYKVARNTDLNEASNGFNVNIQPPPYSNGYNALDDDSASSYTYVQALDFGDAPASYGTAGAEINLITDEGSNYVSYVYLGTTVDQESTNQPSAAADWDDTNGSDDEDGVTFPTLTAGATAVIPVTLTIEDADYNETNNRLNAWIDWNGDGDFADAGEKIANNILIGASEIRNLSVTVPAGAITTQPTFTRFRFGPNMGSTGMAAYGEVEDYQIVILAAASVGDRVWYDLDANGVQNGIEAGIGGVRVYVDLDGSGTYSAEEPTATTASNGSYTIGSLPAGTYTARVDVATLPSGLIQTYDLNGALDHASTVMLTPGETRTDVDFGYRPSQLYSISGAVKDDYDMDGEFSDPDQPVGGVLIRLWSDGDGDGTPTNSVLLAETRTLADGTYAFSNLVSGAYVVEEIDPVYSVSTADAANPNNNWIPVTVAGANSLENNFLDAVDPSGYFYDVTDGRIVPGGSVQVTGDGALVLMDGSSGQYMFVSTNPVETVFTLAVTLPPGYLLDPSRPAQPGTFDPTGLGDPVVLGSYEKPLTPGYLDNYSASSNVFYLTFRLAPGDPAVINNNFPLLHTGSIGDLVWDDSLGTVNNGIQDPGETGLVGVAVTLYRLVDLGGGAVATNEVGTTVTDASGQYRFLNVVPGDFFVGIATPPGYAVSRRKAGGNPHADSDVVQATGQTGPVTLPPGQALLEVDAGLYYAPLLAVVLSFRAVERDGATAVEWEVAEEFDTLRYWLERRVGDAWVRVNSDAPVWAQSAELPWGPYLYEVADPGAAVGAMHTWRLVEEENSGTLNVYGPYTVAVGGPATDFDAWAAGVAWDGAAAGRDDDPDGDGLTNLEEYLAGTDPLRADSTLRITSLRTVPRGIEIRWPSVEGKVYAVEFVRELGGKWLPVSPEEPATPPENAFVLPGTDQGFFRIVLKAVP